MSALVIHVSYYGAALAYARGPPSEEEEKFGSAVPVGDLEECTGCGRSLYLCFRCWRLVEWRILCNFLKKVRKVAV